MFSFAQSMCICTIISEWRKYNSKLYKLFTDRDLHTGIPGQIADFKLKYLSLSLLPSPVQLCRSIYLPPVESNHCQRIIITGDIILPAVTGSHSTSHHTSTSTFVILPAGFSGPSVSQWTSVGVQVLIFTIVVELH